MPKLIWNSKSDPQPIPASLRLDSYIYPQGEGYPQAIPGNRLILGDNLAAMSALLPEYAGRVQLIYADPPFFTNRRYPARVGRGEDSRRPQDWRMADGYPDHWANIEAYLDMLYPRLHLMHQLLADDGSLYLHLDWHADHYARLLLDEIFGAERLLNEIVWVYHGPSPIRSAFNRKHDTILAYTKGKHYTFNVDQVRQPYDPNTVKTFESSRKAGFGKIPNLERGKVPEDWWYFPVVARLHNERTGYPTQKPEALLERIILASSNPGDLVADFFCGSGTTPVVASRLGRNFLASDAAWRAIHTTRTRLVETRSQPLGLWYESRAGLVNRAAEPDQFHFNAEGDHLALSAALAEDLDYWEIDPDWKGQTFHSAVQATRPRSKGTLACSLPLPTTGISRQIAVRLVGVNGEQAQAVLDMR